MGRLLISIAILLLISAVLGPSCADEGRISIPSESDAHPANQRSHAEGDANIEPRTKRVLLVISPECERCATELKRLEAVGGPFESMRRHGWKIGRGPDNHIQIVDQLAPIDPDISRVVSELHLDGSPLVLYVENGEIARSFQRGCTTPLDQWTFGWLMTGNDERPVAFDPEPIQVATTGHYPLRGNHWSVNGNWTPSREELIQHLRSAHARQLQANWDVESWSLEELRSMHDDLHDREEGFRGRVARSSTSRSSTKSSNVFRKPGNASR